MMTSADVSVAGGPAPQGAGRVALVTGGAIRVGRAVAVRLAQAGLDVAITYRSSQAQAASAAEEIRALGRRCHLIHADFEDAAAVEHVHEQVSAACGRLDVLVNNASVFDATPLGTLTHEAFDRQMKVNALAPLMLMQKFAPMLAARHRAGDAASTGRIVNFIDIHVMGQHLKGYMAYNVSKAALMEATMTAALELAPAVTVNAIAPGVVAWAESYTPEARQAYMRRVPLARPGTPEDAAAAVKFLACDAHYCTGQIIRLDGGRFIT